MHGRLPSKANVVTRRVSELDAVRGVAVLIVVVYHLYLTTGTRWDWLLEHGWMAVDLFFLLSGYLITTIIIGHGGNAEFFRSFYVRRSLRIWPIYYLSLLGVLLLTLVWSSAPQFEPWSLLRYLTFTQETPLYWSTESHSHPLLGHFWSLAVEEQFYLFWPLLVAVMGRKRIIPASLTLIALAFAARFAGLHRHLLISRCDSLAAGAILAVLTAYRQENRRKLIAGFAAAALGSMFILAAYATFVDRSIVHQDSLLMFVTPILFGLLGLVICFQGHPLLAVLRNRVLCYCGTISYGIYVYHWIIYLILDRAMPESSRTLWATGLKLSLSLTTAMLSWQFIERPILKLKNRFGYGRDRGESESAPALASTKPWRPNLGSAVRILRSWVPINAAARKRPPAPLPGAWLRGRTAR